MEIIINYKIHIYNKIYLFFCHRAGNNAEVYLCMIYNRDEALCFGDTRMNVLIVSIPHSFATE